MNVAKLIKGMPTLILVASVGYFLATMESEIPEAVEAQAEAKKGLEQLVHDVIAESSTAAAKIEGKLRDPFWIPPPAPTEKEAAAQEVAASNGPDEIADIVREMSLDATFIRGREQLAVIDGRLYNKGQKIPLPADDSGADRSMQIVAVTRVGVLLKGPDKHYKLGYPEQFGKKKPEDGEPESARERAIAEIDPAGQMEMFQNLLNSPLGKMGRGLIGGVTDSDRPAGAAAKGRKRAGTTSRALGSGAGNR